METHRRLTYVGAVLLVVTFLINHYHQTDHPDAGFNYAYITGVAMLAAFAISFVLFTKERMKS